MAALLSIQGLWVGAVGFFAWILRDGLGPEAVESSGMAAAGRMFWTFYWGPVCLAFVMLDAALWLRRGAGHRAR